MRLDRRLVTASEIVFLNLAVLACELAFAGPRGFEAYLWAPYMVPAVWLVSLRGRPPALACLAASVGVGIVASPYLRAAPGAAPGAGYWASLPLRAGPGLAGTIGAIYLVGMARARQLRSLAAMRERLRARTGQLSAHKKALDAMQVAYLELDERIGKNEELLTNIYQYVRRLNRHNVRRNLEGLAAMLHEILRARAVTVYRAAADENALEPVVATGGAREESLPVAGSLEGWVYRNDQEFSVRMILENRMLAQLDEGRCLLCYPISVRNAAWGVLNVEDMDFIKYNKYSEKLLAIILKLAAESLERAVEFEALVGSDDVDAETGLPLYGQFMPYLEHEFRRASAAKSSLSLALVEVANAGDLARENPDIGPKRLVSELVARFFSDATAGYQVFMLDRDDGLALVYPGKDDDGISQFVLEFLGRVNEREWIVNDKRVNPELSVGFASLSRRTSDPKAMLDRAYELMALFRR